jgi:hypothetical protein
MELSWVSETLVLPALLCSLNLSFYRVGILTTTLTYDTNCSLIDGKTHGTQKSLHTNGYYLLQHKDTDQR